MEKRTWQYRGAVGIALVLAVGVANLTVPATFRGSQAAFGQTEVRLAAAGESPTKPRDVAHSSRASSAASRLRFEAGPEIFPPRWREAPFFARATPMDHLQQERAARIVSREIERYPPALIERTLTAVFLVGGLQFYDRQAFSGTASAHAVYLAVQTPELGYTDQHLAKTFHQEYSTLLLNWNLDKIDFDAWQRVNPPDFAYLDGNSWDGGEQYPAIATKCELAVRFYQQLAPTLDEAFFRNLARQVETTKILPNP